MVLTALVTLLPQDPGAAPDRAALPARHGARGPARRHRTGHRWGTGLVGLLNWFFLEPGRHAHAPSRRRRCPGRRRGGGGGGGVRRAQQCRRAERAVAARRESAALAELTHTLLGSTHQMTVLLEHAVDMFGAQRALVVRRATPAEVIAEVEPGTSGPASGETETTPSTAEGEHDLVPRRRAGACRLEAAAGRVLPPTRAPSSNAVRSSTPPAYHGRCATTWTACRASGPRVARRRRT